MSVSAWTKWMGTTNCSNIFRSVLRLLPSRFSKQIDLLGTLKKESFMFLENTSCTVSKLNLLWDRTDLPQPSASATLDLHLIWVLCAPFLKFKASSSKTGQRERIRRRISHVWKVSKSLESVDGQRISKRCRCSSSYYTKKETTSWISITRRWWVQQEVVVRSYTCRQLYLSLRTTLGSLLSQICIVDLIRLTNSSAPSIISCLN